MTCDQILNGLRKMYDNRPKRMALRRKFEAKEWKMTENFADYHEKVILAKNIPIDEDEMVDYLIDGIPNERIRDMARVKEFACKEDMLRVFEKFSLKSEGMNLGRRDSRYYEKIDKKNNVSRSNVNRVLEDKKDDQAKKDNEILRKKIRCYNCSKFSHWSNECKEPKRKKDLASSAGKKSSSEQLSTNKREEANCRD